MTPAQNRNPQSIALEADLSHELRASLTNIIGLLDLIGDSPLTSSQKEWVGAVHSSARALLKLVNDVSELSLIESRRVSLESAPLSLADLLRDVAILFARRAQEQNIELIVRIDPALPAVLFGDAGRIRQVLTNLIDNALKFTAQGYVLIEASLLEESVQRVLVQIEVEDSGAGVPADRRERIFERFAQGMNNDTATEKGSGLGLAISRELALGMQGSLRYVSRPGTGAVFQLNVPLERGEDIAPLEVTEAQAEILTRRVLLVEDDPLSRRISREVLERAGYAVTTTISGKEALEIAQVFHFDLILLDIRLPDMDAIVLLQAIKTMGRNAAATRYAFLTAYSPAELPPDFPQTAVDAILTKPLTPETLKNLFQNASSQAREMKTQETVPKPPIETLGVLNHELLWERVGKKPEALQILIALCKAQYPPLIAEIRDALQRSDIPAFQNAAHRLRGMMMSIYANAATEAVRRYEQAVEEKDRTAMSSADNALNAEILRLEFALNRLLGDRGE